MKSSWAVVFAAAFTIVAAVAIVVLCFERPTSGADQWYATFEYNGETYAFSHAAAEDYWTTVVGDEYANAENPAPDGDAGEKGQTWCNETLITDGTDDAYDDWFLPNVDELMAGRNGYEGGDPFDLNTPDLCHGYDNMGLQALWAATTCFQGTSGCDRAYFLYRTTERVIDDYVPQYLHCENEGQESHWCCMKKWGYGIIATCPMVRCVRILGSEPLAHHVYLPCLMRRIR